MPIAKIKSRLESQETEFYKSEPKLEFTDDKLYLYNPLPPDKWYAYPIENKKPENIKALKEDEDLLSEARVCGESEDQE